MHISPPYRVIGQSIWVLQLIIVPTIATTVAPETRWAWCCVKDGQVVAISYE